MTLAAQDLVFWYQATRLARASASCRYRMGHLAEVLRGATTIVDPRPPLRRFHHAKVLIVVRPYVDPPCAATLEACRDRGTRLVADYDDLLFAGPVDELPLVRSGSMHRDEGAARMARYRDGLSHFDAFTVSTTPLRQHLVAARSGAQVCWVPNGLSRSWVEQGRRLYRPWQPGDPKVIRYLAGSPSHDADLAEVTEPLEGFMRDHEDVRLELVGPVNLLPGALPAERVSHHPAIPYAELPRLLAASWLTIAPLSANEFNRSKSCIKYLESAAFGTPCVASPSADMVRHQEGGAVLAKGDQQWQQALERLYDDAQRTQLSEEGLQYIDRWGCAEQGAGTLMEWLETTTPASP